MRSAGQDEPTNAVPASLGDLLLPMTQAAVHQRLEGPLGVFAGMPAAVVALLQLPHGDAPAPLGDPFDQFPGPPLGLPLPEHGVDAHRLGGEPARQLDAGAGAGLSHWPQVVHLHRGMADDVVQEHQSGSVRLDLGKGGSLLALGLELDPAPLVVELNPEFLGPGDRPRQRGFRLALSARVSTSRDCSRRR